MRNPGRVRLFILLPLLLTLFLSPVVYAQSTTPTGVLTTPTDQCSSIFPSTSTGQSSSTQIPGYAGFPTNWSWIYGAVLIGLMVSFDVIAIAYILNKLVPSTRIGNWLQREYWEFVKSAILVAVIFLVITFVSGIGVILSGAPAANGTSSASSNINSLLYSTEGYLCTVNSQINYAITNVAPIFMGLGLFQGTAGGGLRITFNGFPITFPLPWVPTFRSGVAFNIFSSLLLAVQFVFLGQFQSTFIDYLLFLIVPMKLVFSSQIILLPFFVSLGLAVLIPIGLILRALPFTRGIGGTIIAYGIGFAVVWPSILVLFNAPVSSYFCGILSGGQNSFCNTSIGPSPSTVSLAQQAQAQASTVCAPMLNQAAGTGLNSSSIVYTVGCEPILAAVSQWWGTTGSTEIVLAWESISSLYPSLNLFYDYGMYMVLQLFVIFILDLMIFYALTDNIARMLGGTLRLQLGRKLKLI